MELILLHGFDATPADLSDVAESLRSTLTGWAVRTIAGPVSTEGGRHAWWSEGDGAYRDVGHALAWISDRIGTDPVVIAGFSQGGALALACGFGATPPERVGGSASGATGSTGPSRSSGSGGPIAANIRGVACIGGFVPDDVVIGPSDISLFVGHGVEDDVVDVFHAESLGRLATRHAIANEVTLHGGGHAWPESITDSLASWLRRLP